MWVRKHRGKWQWERTWTGLYCIIIDNRVVRDVWKSPR